MPKGVLSDSGVVIWRLAELEARNVKSAEIAPEHLFLALAKSVDIDMPSVLDKGHPSYNNSLEELLREVRRIRTIFDGADLDPKTVRRRLRKTLMGDGRDLIPTERIHRSPATKTIFSKAIGLAEISGGVVYPTQLLLAVLITEDENRDLLLQELGVNKEHLIRLAREEAGFRKARRMRETKHSFGN